MRNATQDATDAAAYLPAVRAPSLSRDRKAGPRQLDARVRHRLIVRQRGVEATQRRVPSASADSAIALASVAADAAPPTPNASPAIASEWRAARKTESRWNRADDTRRVA